MKRATQNKSIVDQGKATTKQEQEEAREAYRKHKIAQTKFREEEQKRHQDYLTDRGKPEELHNTATRGGSIYKRVQTSGTRMNV